MDFSAMNQLMNQSMDQPMNLLTKSNTKGTRAIRKLSRDETRQMEMFKKMSKQERKMFAVKHVSCLHRCVPARGIYCLTFRELCGDAPYSPMY